MDYYKGKKNRKTLKERNEYWTQCLKDKRAALFVYEKIKNARVVWDSDPVYPYCSADRAAHTTICSIIDKYKNKASWGFIGVHFGSYCINKEQAEPLAKELREFLDAHISHVAL